MNLSINETNFNLTASLVLSSPYEFLFQIDTICRWYGITIFILFALILFFSKKMHTRVYLYINHCVLVSVVYCFMMFVYLFGNYPNFQDKLLNEVLCYMSEIAWIFGIYIRTYSILLIAIQRYLAVFKISLFKKLNSSLFYLIAPLIFIWLFSLLMPIITKYSFNTKASAIFCLDGYSLVFSDTISYIVVNYTLMVIIPSIITLVIYYLIIRKLSILDKKIGVVASLSSNQDELATNNNIKTPIVSNHTSLSRRKDQDSNTNSTPSQIKNINEVRMHSKKNHRFAKQFLLMCFTVIASSIVHTIFSLRSVIPDFFIIFYYWRPVLRSYLIIVISLIPIITIYYHPSRHQVIKKIKSTRTKLFSSKY